MSEFVYLFRSTPEGQQEALGTPERAQRTLESYMAWIRELEAGGHLKQRGQPLERTGAVVSAATVTDGPYVEAKDMVLGFIVVEARDLAHAAQLATGCPIVHGGGSVEIRPVMPLAL